MILQIALDTPLRRVFDYRPPTGFGPEGSRGVPRLGVRVRVPFGRQQLFGILVGFASESAVDSAKLRAAVDILDQQPVFDPITFDLLLWAAEYYHHPVGEVFAAALPVSLRAGQPALQRTEWWSLTEEGRQEISSPTTRRAPQQRALLAWLSERGRATEADIGEAFNLTQLRGVTGRGWVTSQSVAPDSPALESRPSEVELTDAQSHCVAAILASLTTFAAHLLYGVTGSGKTEVYLRVIAAAIAAGGQALVLVPEIRVDASAGGSLPATIQFGGGRAAFGSYSRRTPRCLASGPRRSGTHRHRNPFGGVHFPAETRAHRARRGARRLV